MSSSSSTSFLRPTPERHCAPAGQLAAVLLGEDLSRESIDFALGVGPLTFVNKMSTDVGALAEALVVVLEKRARLGERTFAASSFEIAEILRFFLKTVFGDSHLHRISITVASKMQRLLYLVCAKTVAQFGKLDERSSATEHAQFRAAVHLVGELAEATKHWLPVAAWLDGWTRWHALAFVLELSSNNILAIDSRELSEFRVLQFFEHVFFQIALETPHTAFSASPPDDDDTDETDTEESYESDAPLHPACDLGTSFGWVCRSRVYGNLYKRMARQRAKHFPALARFADFYKALGTCHGPPPLPSLPAPDRPSTPTRSSSSASSSSSSASSAPSSSSSSTTPRTSPHEQPLEHRRAKRRRLGSECQASVRQLDF